MEFLGWPHNDSLQPNMGFVGLVVQQTANHKDISMKITKSLTERLFVMFLQRELDFSRLIGEVPDMKHCVDTADGETQHTIETLEESSPKPKSATGGEA